MGETGEGKAETKNMEVTPSPSDAVDEWGPFHCQICLDLVYKPIVHACGHIFCFWCVYEAMNGIGTSHCPLCRRPYKHFPRVCELLHYFLFKAFPKEYRKREEEVLEMEMRTKVSSPQLSDPPNAKRIDRSKLNSSSSTEGFSGGESLQSDSVPESTVTSKCTTIISSDEKIKSGTKLIQQSASSIAETSLNMYNVEANIVQESVAPSTLNVQDNAKCCISQNNITVDDVLCCYCEELLYQPTVLNCGHAFCESCISISENGTLKCQICQCLHPGGQLHVCLELHYFLECTFPAEYAERKKKVLEHKKMCQQPNKDSATCLANVEIKTAEAPDNPSQEAIIHDAGCDYCGISPIVGKRYKCMDCPESIGFDLCETCYEKGSKLPGRFNQRHTEEHRFQALHGDSRFELVLPNLMNQFSWIAQVIPVDLEHGSSVMSTRTESTENSGRIEDESDEDHPDLTL